MWYHIYRFKLRPSGIPNPALPEGGSTGAGNSNSTVTSNATATVTLHIRSSCSGGSNLLPTKVTGVGPSGAAEALVKDLFSVHPDQRLTQAILTASSSYSNTNNVQVSNISLVFYLILCHMAVLISCPEYHNTCVLENLLENA